MRGNDILDTALYGGFTYWAACAVRTATTFTLVNVGDDDGEITVKVGALVPAAREVVRKYPHTQGAAYIRQALAEDDPGMIDAEAADMIVQVAAFGEIVYG